MKKKSQEEDSQMLIESQEVIYQKISEALSQSSHSTNVGELEDTLLREMGSVYCTDDSNSEGVNSFPKYDLRPRTATKQRRNSQRRTSDASVSKKPKLKSRRKESETDRSFPSGAESPETGGYSQESVSMLQECYEKAPTYEFPELMDTCTKFESDIINIYSDEEIDESSWGVEISTQTDSTIFRTEPAHPRELEMGKHMDFLRSVVKLKAVLSARESVPDRKLRDILNKGVEEMSCMSEGGKGNFDRNVPRETIGYLFRCSDAENVFCETVQMLLAHLEDGLRENFSKIVCFWENSVYEAAVEMLNEAVDSEARIRKMVELFLFGIIGSISKNEEKLKNLMLEAKAMFVVNFCQSTHLSYTTINYLIANLEIVKTISRTAEHTSIAEKLSATHLTKNSYFLLRMLESLLESFRAKLAGGKMEDIVTKKSKGKNFNVLETWRRHWSRNEVPEEQGGGHQWEVTVGRWCEELDGLSRHCINHVPVLSMVVERCGELSKDVFKISHPDLTGQRQGTKSSAKKAVTGLEMDL